MKIRWDKIVLVWFWCSAVAFVVVVPAMLAYRSVWLGWDYEPYGSEITFNVYSKTNFADAWRLKTNVPVCRVEIPLVFAAEFFTVTATNSILGKESEYSR